MTPFKKHVHSRRHAAASSSEKNAIVETARALEHKKQVEERAAAEPKTALCSHPEHLIGERGYEPSVNHAACVEHQLWWRNPAFVGAAVVAAIVGTVGVTSTVMLVPGLSSDFHRLAFVPFIATAGQHRQAEREFQLLCKRGQDFVTRGKVDQGLAEFKKAESITDVSDRLKAELFNDIAVTLHGSGQSQDSVKYLERAIKTDPTLVAARSNLAMVLVELGDTEHAVVVLKEAIRMQPGNSCLVHRLVNLTGNSRMPM